MIYENLRSFKNGVKLEDWVNTYRLPNFPIWLQGIGSVTRGASMGYVTKLEGHEQILTINDFNKT